MARHVIIPIEREAAMTFRDLARACFFQLESWGYSIETRYVYDRAWTQFLSFVKARGGTDDIRSFNDRNVFAFSEWLGLPNELRPAIHPNTIIKTLSALSTLARYGMMRHDDQDRRLVREDPTKSFRWPQAQRVETKWVYPDEIKKLADVEAPTYKAIARDLLIETGIRVGEACRLNVENFKAPDDRYFLSVKTKGRGQQRRVETRDIPISRGLGDAIRDWVLARGLVGEQHGEQPLLINSEGLRWKRAVLSNMITRLADQAGITRLRVSAHKLRHSANVRDRIAGIDAVTRARLRGHTSLRSLERYDHVLPGELHDATEKSLDQLQQWLGRPFRADTEASPETQNEQAPNNPERRENQ